MAVVYKGFDEVLQRNVAIKVLRPEYGSDSDFVRRFRREAQAAANLFHANIVNVYDVGEDGGLHYMVMEFVEGKTLKQLIRERGRLRPRDAARIVVQICEGLQKAHSGGIVHRDVKPHNILIDPSGRVKVADFGIARAISGSTLTKTGTMMGSAHYVSPEQAQGDPTDVRSDIYSLGITFYEMLTGVVPFDAESAVGIAVQHLEQEAVPPSEVSPEVPPKIDEIVLACLEKDPDRRPQTARELADLLDSWLNESRGEGRTPLGGRRRRAADIPVPLRIGAAALIAVAILALLLVGGTKLISGWLHVPAIEVPSVIGQEASEAEASLREAGFQPSIVGERYDDAIAAGKVCSQDPRPGEAAKKGRRVELTLSKGPERVLVPDVRRMTFAEADVALKAESLDFGNVTYEYHESIPKDSVIDQDPMPQSSVARGSLVDLVLSSGPEPRKIILRSFLGMSLESARAEIASLGLVLEEVEEEESHEFEAGMVTDQSPDPGTTLAPGDGVSLTVSKGGSLFHSENVTISVPRDGRRTVEVKAVVEDSRGVVTAYMQDHRPGDVFEVKIQWKGREARLRVYFDDELGAERVLRARDS